jgi:hypothetical protein
MTNFAGLAIVRENFEGSAKVGGRMNIRRKCRWLNLTEMMGLL